MDGTPTLRMNEFMLASIAANKIELGPPRTSETASDLPDPKELEFVLDDRSKANIRQAEARFDELVSKHDLHVIICSDVMPCKRFTASQVLHYEGYGKSVIKKFKVSPDAWAQLVKQLAFHKMFGRPGVTYESAQTRKYKLGRTEVIRAASSETKAWAEAMSDPEVTVSHFLTRSFSVIDCFPLTYLLHRTNTAPFFSAELRPGIYSMRPGQLTARVLTDTCLGLRK
jgi:carnitine O-acetyltransferase